MDPEDIHVILMTHLHNDHAAGLTMARRQTRFCISECCYLYSQVEWDEMRNPNIRSRNTYWKENWEPVQDK